jgi:hypothetical protein
VANSPLLESPVCSEVVEHPVMFVGDKPEEVVLGVGEISRSVVLVHLVGLNLEDNERPAQSA